jgi:glycosyltransferase involved in cell wall biosynthesis
MKILMVNKRAPFEGRGAERVIWQIGKRFAEAGHRIRFFCPNPTSDTSVPNVDGIDFSFVETSEEPTRSMIEFFLLGPLEYRSVYSSCEPDVVYDNPSPFPFGLAHFYGDATVVSKVHAIYRRLAFSCKDHPLVKVGTVAGEETYRLYRNEHFVTNSESTATRLRSLVDTAANELVANPIGIDAEAFEWVVPEISKQVVTVSKLSPRKRIGDLLQAWSTVERSHPDATLTIGGSGPLEDDLRALRDRLGLDTVCFEGFVREGRKHELLQQSAVFAAPTLYEGFGLSILEAMASGCAVATTDTWGVRDFVEHGINGVMAPPKSPDAFAEGLCQLLEDAAARKCFARAGRDTAETYSMAKSLDRELGYLESLHSESSR